MLKAWTAGTAEEPDQQEDGDDQEPQKKPAALKSILRKGTWKVEVQGQVQRQGQGQGQRQGQGHRHEDHEAPIQEGHEGRAHHEGHESREEGDRQDQDGQQGQGDVQPDHDQEDDSERTHPPAPRWMLQAQVQARVLPVLFCCGLNLK